MSKSVEELLRTGPFPDALRAAIAASGLCLDRIRERLRAQGTPVSTATLSYWQSGRSQPERRRSLDALVELEAVLELRAGALTALLLPPRPRGRWLRTPAGPGMDELWAGHAEVAEYLSRLDTRWDDGLTRISQHDRFVVGPDRGERYVSVRQVLRAEVDGVDRLPVIHHLDEHGRALADVRPVRHCRLGRVHREESLGVVVAELLFDRALIRGETVITEHAVVNTWPYPRDTSYERKLRSPVREYTLEVGFHPDMVPVRCEQFVTTGTAPEDVRVRNLVPDGSGWVHSVALDAGVCSYGIRWDWE